MIRLRKKHVYSLHRLSPIGAVLNIFSDPTSPNFEVCTGCAGRVKCSVIG